MGDNDPIIWMHEPAGKSHFWAGVGALLIVGSFTFLLVKFAATADPKWLALAAIMSGTSAVIVPFIIKAEGPGAVQSIIVGGMLALCGGGYLYIRAFIAL